VNGVNFSKKACLASPKFEKMAEIGQRRCSGGTRRPDIPNKTHRVFVCEREGGNAGSVHDIMDSRGKPRTSTTCPWPCLEPERGRGRGTFTTPNFQTVKGFRQGYKKERIAKTGK